jgi:hypothetical protein
MKPRRIFHLIPHEPRGLIIRLGTELDLPTFGLCGRRLSFPVEERRVSSKDCRKCRRAADLIQDNAKGNRDQLPHLWWS